MNKKVKLALTMVAAAAVVGCAQNRSEPGRGNPSDAGAAIMQVGYGVYAKYVTCPLSGCPRPTPKTIAGAPEATAAAQPAPAPVVEMVATKAEPAPAKVEVPVAPEPVQAKKAELQPEPAVAPAPVVAPALPAPEPEPVKAEPPAEPASAAVEKTALPDGQQRIYINFPTRSARLSDEAKEQLDRLVPQVLGAERVVIKGRTDQRGDSDTNDRLAFRRAMAVYDHLRRAAKAGDKPFKLLAKGACCYIARNDTEEGRAANRRAEIDFVVPLQASATTNRRASSKASSS